MKLIIDIPEQGFESCKLWVKMGVASWQDEIIAKGTKYEERPTDKWINVDDFSKWLKEQYTGYDYSRCEVLVERDGIWRNAVKIYLKEMGEK